MPVHAQEPEGGVTDAHPTRFPMTDRTQTYAEKIRGIVAAHASENALITKLLRLDQIATRKFPEMPGPAGFRRVLYIM